MSAKHSKARKYWSGEVTRQSNALDLERGVVTWKNPKRIAKSLKRSAEESTRKKGTPYQSSMSMLTFYMKSCREEFNCGPDKRTLAGEVRTSQTFSERIKVQALDLSDRLLSHFAICRFARSWCRSSSTSRTRFGLRAQANKLACTCSTLDATASKAERLALCWKNWRATAKA